jgi:hypothetical protein
MRRFVGNVAQGSLCLDDNESRTENVFSKHHEDHTPLRLIVWWCYRIRNGGPVLSTTFPLPLLEYLLE